MLLRDRENLKHFIKASNIRHTLFLFATVILATCGVVTSLSGADETSNLPKGSSGPTEDTANSDRNSALPGPSTSTTHAGADANSLRLFQNFASVSGVKDRNIQHVVATGSFKYGKLDERRFTLVETRNGDRFLELKWRYQGSDYRETLVSKSDGKLWKKIAKAVIAQDGSPSWQDIFQEEIQNNRVDFRKQYNHTVISNGVHLRAKPLNNTQLQVISSQYAELPFSHFRSNYLFLQPFTTPAKGRVGYKFLGSQQLPLVKDKEVYAVSQQGNQSFLFDKENFLLLKWGGPGVLAGTEVEIAFYATSFNRWDGAIFPAQIKVIANGVSIGDYTVDQVSINGTYNLDLRLD